MNLKRTTKSNEKDNGIVEMCVRIAITRTTHNNHCSAENIWQLYMCEVAYVLWSNFLWPKFEHSIITCCGWHLCDVPLFVIYLISVLLHISFKFCSIEHRVLGIGYAIHQWKEFKAKSNPFILCIHTLIEPYNYWTNEFCYMVRRTNITIK